MSRLPKPSLAYHCTSLALRGPTVWYDATPWGDTPLWPPRPGCAPCATGSRIRIHPQFHTARRHTAMPQQRHHNSVPQRSNHISMPHSSATACLLLALIRYWNTGKYFCITFGKIGPPNETLTISLKHSSLLRPKWPTRG